MSKDEFMIDYSNCKDFNREIKSNINYLNEILEKVSTSNTKMDGISDNGKKVWSPIESIESNNSLNTNLTAELERYEGLHTKFESFYTNVEDMDSQLASYVSAQISSIDENEDNYEFLIAMIQLNNNDIITENVYQMLLDSGLTEEEARNLVMLLSIEGQNEIVRLSKLTSEELEKERKKLSDKENKTLLDKILEEILAYPNPINFINELTGQLEDGAFTSYVEKAILGRTLAQAKLDIKSIKGSINKLMDDIVSPNLSKAAKSKVSEMLTNLNQIGGTRLSKIKYAEGATKALQKLGKAVSVVIIAVDTLENGIENWEYYQYYGTDSNRAWYDFAIDETGLITSIIVGGKAGLIIGTAAAGPLGTVVGGIVGITGGIITGIFVDGIINEAGDFIYNNVLEPVGDWWNDTCNDVGDWWDSLWW